MSALLGYALKQLPGIVAGVVVASALLIIYNTLFDDPAVRAETRAIVQAENEKFTTEAIDEIASNADKARAMRAYCASIGKLYDFAKIECRD